MADGDTLRLAPALDLWLESRVFEHHAAAGLASSEAQPFDPERPEQRSQRRRAVMIGSTSGNNARPMSGPHAASKAAEIEDAALLIASDRARYITGQLLCVGGGYSVGTLAVNGPRIEAHDGQTDP